MTGHFESAPPPLPASLQTKLHAYRKRLWSTKTTEAVAAALFGLLLSYLLVFGLDRVVETPSWARGLLLAAGLIGGALFLPLQLSRWIGKHKTLDDVARRIAREDIATGDRVLSVMELSSDEVEFRRSPELATAAIDQGERELRDKSFDHTLPKSRHRAWSGFAAASAVAMIGGFVIAPAAAKNAFARWTRPFGDVERYTFTQLEPFEKEQVVARFEAFQAEFRLSDETEREPAEATLELHDGTSSTARLEGGSYVFPLEGLARETTATLALGDYRGNLRLLPLDRPEVQSAEAHVKLPAYLELDEPKPSDVRGGSLGVVAGSEVSIRAELTRELGSAAWTAGEATVAGATLTTRGVVLDESRDTELSWTDVHGLDGLVPFKLGLRARSDAAPTVRVEGLVPNSVLLHDTAASFTVHASDDFGARQVGLVWEGEGEPEGDYESARGEKWLGAGDPDDRTLDLQATLHPKLLGIDPQFLIVRAFVLDALPGRERSYSAPIRVQVMTEDEHMIWMTRSLAGWYDEAVEVRDAEQQLLQTNEELFEMSNAALASPANQRKLQEQANAERANGRRLNRLTAQGNRLLAEAARNDQFNSNTLDDWAEMMSTLQNIADSRMPQVADGGRRAAKAEKSKGASVAGVNRQTPQGTSAQANPPEDKLKLPDAPQVADVESSFNDSQAPKAGEGGAKATPPPANLSLAGTVVQGGGAKDDSPPPPADEDDDTPGPTKEELAKAHAAQRELMTEFQKVAGQISNILKDLEGSTFVKRLKSLSRAESGVAKDLDATLTSAFGASDVPQDTTKTVSKVTRIQETSGQRAALVREDLGAYLARLETTGRDANKFKKVYDEMSQVGVTREMGAIGDLAAISRAGEAIAGAENLADDLDRWAEILVGPG